MQLVLPMMLSFTGVGIAALAFLNRDKPEWQRNMRRIYILAFGQIALGVTTWFLLTRT
jgi:hypothetical protein